jgi:DNA-3-methyladenine glycosylase I
LESAQTGLASFIILGKRENYRLTFTNIEPNKVIDFDQKNIGDLMKNSGIERYRIKIESIINNRRQD